MSRYKQQVDETADFLRSRAGDFPRIGLILGTGLGGLANEMDVEFELGYEHIPHFPVSTVESHSGRLLIGKLGGTRVVAMQGRMHLYEGYSAREVTFPVRVFGTLGVDTLLISNAAGGMNPLYRRADLMLLSDHINLQGANPLIGENVSQWGPRFPDMSDPYKEELRQIARDVALKEGIPLREGVYVSVVGPNLETRAEYRFLRTIGADAVGMSTVPEVIVATHMGIQSMAISVITDECFPDSLEPVSIAEVLAAAAQAEPHLTRIIIGIVQRLESPTS